MQENEKATFHTAHLFMILPVASGLSFFVIKFFRDQPDLELGSLFGGLLVASSLMPDDASGRGPAGAVFGAGVEATGIGGSTAGAGSLVGTGKPPAGW